MFASYLDNIENGPVKIPFLERGQTQNVTLRIEISSQLQIGTYNVTLNYVYSDALGREYQGSNNVLVTVVTVSIAASSTAGLYYAIAAIVVVAAVGISGFMLWKQKRNRPPPPPP